MEDKDDSQDLNEWQQIEPLTLHQSSLPSNTAMRGGVVRVACKVRNCAIYVGAFWSILCVTGAAAVAVLVYRIRRRRRRVGRQSVDHLTYLLREKDEKISQLAVQIAQLNEVISSRRMVPVVRISS
ncbi:hypothetical protein Lalb_Chr09g0329161 [Lupinus albus]|uniref:Transmembrane protein n=1 Tax=Lupinus albus TaxID=3870 RepID=A0A6A4Q084_LUPAL|nr:hypothetical protein Lalb_Chr09g0329161 [Lupinus albus]